MAKKHDLSDKKKIRLSRAVAVAEICIDTSSIPMKARKLKFRLPHPKNESSAAEDVVTEEYLLLQMNLFFWSR
jgi:hypothetical protein